MILLHKKVQQILIDKQVLTPKILEDMLGQYYVAIVSLMLDVIQIYIEEHKLTETEKYLTSIADSIRAKKQSTVDDQVKFYTELFHTIKDYPEISTWIEQSVDDIDAELDKSVLDVLDAEGRLRLVDIIEEDLVEIEKNEIIAKKLMASPDFDKA